MHLHCEIILPPNTEDIEASVASVMKRFDENPDNVEDRYTKNSFWDFYVIGGRWAGSKLMASYDQDLIEEFEKWLRDENVTVSGLQCGKQELSPATQIAKVDAKWNEMFPSSGNVMVACPMFRHSNDQYGRDGNGTIEGDICNLKDAMSVHCERLIIAGPSFEIETKDRTGPLEAVFMLSESIWNGVNHVKSTWDGTVATAVEQWKESLVGMADGYRELMTPTDDWIAVTVDYHT